jgi:CspA family cold shock protein
MNGTEPASARPPLFLLHRDRNFIHILLELIGFAAAEIGRGEQNSYVAASASGGVRQMAKGTVKWFNPTKGYGFIQPQGGGKDVFVHISAVERAGLSTLNEGQVVEYEVVANRGKESAEKLKVG